MEEGGHIFPLGEALLELEHLILEGADLLGYSDELCIAEWTDRLPKVQTRRGTPTS
jgi:hypothetical protein